MEDNPNISATGANEFKAGFSKANLDRHWVGGDSDHSEQYPGYSKSQYAEAALSLVQSETSDTVKGYKNKYGQVARYDITNNNYVKGHPDVGIATMFKPDDGIEYYKKFEKYEAKQEG